MELALRVNVQYAAPPTASVRQVLQIFQRPGWVRYVMQHVTPQLRNVAPTDKTVLAELTSQAQPYIFGDDKQVLAGDDNDGGPCCVVCLCSIEELQEVVRLPCLHCFHIDCARSWLQRRSTCPSCRHQLPKAYTGKYTVLSMDSGLKLKKEYEDLSLAEILELRVGADTVNAVVLVKLSQKSAEQPVSSPVSGSSCVISAHLVQADGGKLCDDELSAIKMLQV